MDKIISSELCTGCGACAAACPMQSIRMQADGAGFLRPHITESCVNCGKCLKICPRLNGDASKKNKNIPKAFAAVSKNKDVWRRSSSGGAFSEICKAWEQGSTVFCGAAWDGVTVRHRCVTGTEKLAPLCKSKYVASDAHDCYKQLKTHLDAGGNAVFCGTPCQVAGLKAFLGREYKKLLLIDLICHGVGSPAVFEECLRLTETELNGKIESYEFRSKGRVYDKDHIVKITLKNKKGVVLIENDRYLQLFVRQDCLRSSCAKNCIWRNEAREGDITIGDFKGLRQVFPKSAGTKRNYSTIVINNEKGELVLPFIEKKMSLLPCDIEDIQVHNPVFYRHTYFSKERDAFFAEFERAPERAIHERTAPCKLYSESFKKKFWNCLPCMVRRCILIWSKKQ